MIDAKAFGAELAGIVKAATAPLLARIDALEKALADRPEPQPGKDGRDGSDGKDGASVTVDDVLPALQRQVDEYLANLPAPKDGKDGIDGKDGEPGEPGRDGRDGVDGKDGAPGRDGIDGKDGEPGQPGEKGADGIGLAGALIDRDGNLVVTLTNGETKALGSVVGKDGAPGEDGRPGQDGIGFDDMTLDYDGERTFTFLFQRGERIEERKFVVPVMLDRGVYRPETAYAKGDAVTYGGSVWIAQTETKARPDGSADWRLAVKKGRDGKDGAVKAAEDRAPLKVGGRNAG